MNSLYEILGVDAEASAEGIKTAYKVKASLYHPDKGTGDIEKFRETQQAYETLKDHEKRRVYDTTGIVGGDLFILEQARDNLMALFYPIVQQCAAKSVLADTDLIEHLHHAIELNRKTVYETLANFRSLLRAYQSAESRLIGGDPVLPNGFTVLINQAADGVYSSETQLKILEVMDALTAGYVYKHTGTDWESAH